MPLRRSPVLTPKALAARRANALKSTGPRTPQGKARVRFNGLRFGSRSAKMTGYYQRRQGLDPRKLLAVFRAGRLPGQKIDPVQEVFVEDWLMSECGPHSREVERFRRLLRERDERRWNFMANEIYRMMLFSGGRLDRISARALRGPVGRRLKILDRQGGGRLSGHEPDTSGRESLSGLIAALTTKAGM